MKISLAIPEHTGGAIKVFWEERSFAIVESHSDHVSIKGSKEAFLSFAKQILYFCFNPISSGTHVHYDSFFCNSNLMGLGLLIEFQQADNTDMYGFDDKSNLQDLQIPDDPLDNLWLPNSTIVVSYDLNEVRICGNRVGLFSIAKKMLSLYYAQSDNSAATEYIYPQHLPGWHGVTISFQICTTSQGHQST